MSLGYGNLRFDEYTVLDTMQCRLRDFVLKGGDLFICGNHIGTDMTNHGLYDTDAADTPAGTDGNTIQVGRRLFSDYVVAIRHSKF